MTFLPAECSRFSEKHDELTVHYTGRLASNDKVFDSSVGKAPFKFVLGGGRVIQGWDQGLRGWCSGEKRTLFVPARLGYVACPSMDAPPTKYPYRCTVDAPAAVRAGTAAAVPADRSRRVQTLSSTSSSWRSSTSRTR